MFKTLKKLLQKIKLRKQAKSGYFLYKGRDKRLIDSGLKRRF